MTGRTSRCRGDGALPGAIAILEPTLVNDPHAAGAETCRTAAIVLRRAIGVLCESCRIMYTGSPSLINTALLEAYGELAKAGNLSKSIG